MESHFFSNLEVWYPISSNQIELLENVDLMLLRKLLKGHSKTPKEAFFLECSLLPIKFVAIKKRLMYLHNILTKPKSELISKVYEVHKSVFTTYNLANENRNELGIPLTDEEISVMSKDRFKAIVNKAVNAFALKHFNKLATKSDNLKSINLVKSKFSREKHFEDKRFSISEVELLFSLRANMVAGIKKNFSSH